MHCSNTYSFVKQLFSLAAAAMVVAKCIANPLKPPVAKLPPFDTMFVGVLKLPSDEKRLAGFIKLRENARGLTLIQDLHLERSILGEAKLLKRDTVTAITLLKIGDLSTKLGDFAEGLKCYQEALAFAKRSNGFALQARVEDHTAWVFIEVWEAKHLNKALLSAEKYAKDGLKIADSHNLPEFKFILGHTMATIYSLRNENLRAVELYKSIIKESDKTHLPTPAASLANIYSGLGSCYQSLMQFDSALRWFQKSLLLCNAKALDYDDSLKLSDSKLYISQNLAAVYFSLGQFPKSEHLANKILKEASEKAYPDAEIEMLDLLIKNAQKRHDYKRAYFLEHRRNLLNDSVFSAEKLSQLEYLREQQESSQKDFQIAIQKAEINYHKRTDKVLIPLVLALSLALVGIYFGLRRAKALNATVLAQRDMIEMQLDYLRLMMKELHHRVKNNLQLIHSLLYMQTLELPEGEGLTAIHECSQRLQVIEMVHQMLYKSDVSYTVNVKDYFNNLGAFLSNIYGYATSVVTSEIDDELQNENLDDAVAKGLILNELFTNTFKHGFGKNSNPSIHVRYVANGDKCILSVKDNGSGINLVTWNDYRRSGFGKRLVSQMCKHLHAEERLETDNGACFSFIWDRNK